MKDIHWIMLPKVRTLTPNSRMMAMFDNDSVLQTAFNDSETQQSGSENNWVNHGMENVRMPNTYIKIACVSVSVVGILGNSFQRVQRRARRFLT